MQFFQSARRTLLGACVALLAVGSAYAATSDAWITTKAKMALLTTEGVSATAVNVDTLNGLVTLHGKIGSDAERQKAEAAGARHRRREVRAEPPAGRSGEARDGREGDGRQDQGSGPDRDEVERGVQGRHVQSVNSGVVLSRATSQTLGDHLSAVERAAACPA
jgi:hypothetical protein